MFRVHQRWGKWGVSLALAALLCPAVAQDTHPGASMGAAVPDSTAADESMSLDEQMAARASAYEAWAYSLGYSPSLVNMRATTNLKLQVYQYDFSNPWLEGPFMTGNWGGLREQLFDAGVEFTGGYIGNPFWNPVGGATQEFRWHHYVSAGINFDFEKLADFEGSSFFVSGRWRGGGYLSQNTGITGLYEPSAYVGSEGWRMTETYYRQTWLDDRIELRLGRQIACDPFADLPITYVFINDAIDANIVGISENIPFSTGTVTWSAFLRTWPREDVYVQVGVYNNPLGVGDASNHGVDFGFNNTDGILVMTEACWDPINVWADMPGSYFFGGYVMTQPGQLINYSTGQSIESVWGIYAAATQMVFREKRQSDQEGLSVFVTANWAPEDENPLSFYLSGGLVYVGPIPGRDNDQVALGFAYSEYSGVYSDYSRRSSGFGLDSQTVLELTYSYGVTPWMVIQPDVQYFFDPAANGTVPDTLVVGVQVALTF